MSVLLAGAGDLCLRTGKLLLDQGHRVWALRRHPPGGDTSGVQWLAGDLTRKETLRHVPRHISHVLYAPTPDRHDQAHYRAVFVHGMQNLLESLDTAALRRFVFVSSSAVYGDQAGNWVDECTPAAPSGFSGATLIEAEQWLRQASDSAVVLRLAGLYGPGRLRLVARLQQGAATVPGHAVHWANRIHIDDAARAAAHILTLPSPLDCYIGADGTPHRIDELYDAIAKMAGAPRPARSVKKVGTGSKRLCNARLLASGFSLRWPDAIEGYRALLGQSE
jgi:nucleoside-diphosphate-sugar epimerase